MEQGSEPVVLSKVWETSEFSTIYREHSQAVFYVALRMLNNPSQAEDATHDVFLKAFRKLDTFRGDSQMRTWLYRITINHCQNMAQTWYQRNILTAVDETVWERAADHQNPLQILEVKELGERIQKSLESLPEEYRLLLLLVADEKLSYDEVAQLTEQTADAVRGKLHRARKAFAHHFSKTA